MRRGCCALSWVVALVLCGAALRAGAQPGFGEVEKALLQRQQQEDEFSLRLRHSQERLGPALTPDQRHALDLRHDRQRLRQRDLHDGQVRRHMELQQTFPPLPDERQRNALQREGAQFSRERAEPLD